MGINGLIRNLQRYNTKPNCSDTVMLPNFVNRTKRIAYIGSKNRCETLEKKELLSAKHFSYKKFSNLPERYTNKK
jgi:hypothetical protein